MPATGVSTRAAWWDSRGASAFHLLDQWLDGSAAVITELLAIRCGALFPYELGSAVSRRIACALGGRRDSFCLFVLFQASDGPH